LRGYVTNFRARQHPKQDNAPAALRAGPENIDKIVIIRFQNRNYIIDGHHRCAAAILLGMHTVMAVVFDADKAGLKTREASVGGSVMEKANALTHKTANGGRLLSSLLALLRAAHQAHWTAHWSVEGTSFYADHELLGRLYNAIPGEIDGLAEKIVAIHGAAAVSLVDQLALMHVYGEKWASVSPMDPNPIRRAMIIESDIQEAIKVVRDALKAQDALPLGLDNFLSGVADAHETALYLLGQRSKDSAMAARVASRHMADQNDNFTFFDEEPVKTMKRWKSLFNGTLVGHGTGFHPGLEVPGSDGNYRIEIQRNAYNDGETVKWFVTVEKLPTGGQRWDTLPGGFIMSASNYYDDSTSSRIPNQYHQMVQKAERVLLNRFPKNP
jgi:DNA-binding ferritin-like protein